MNNNVNRFASAVLKYQGGARTEPGEPLVDLFSFEEAGILVWFEVRVEWLGPDYKAAVSNFGIRDRTVALSKDRRLQAAFSSAELETAKLKIQEYFSGPGGAKRAAGRGKCLEVVFLAGWAVQSGA